MSNIIKSKLLSLLFLFSFIFFTSLGYNFYNEYNVRKDVNNITNAVSISVSIGDTSRSAANVADISNQMAEQIDSLKNSIDEFLSIISVS